MSAKEWLRVEESARTLLARSLSRRIPPLTSVPLLHRLPLHAGHVLEIVGPSGAAKSELLLQAAVACILPKQVDGISYGGSEGVVLMFDLDCRFDMLRFVSVLQLRINEASAVKKGQANEELKCPREKDDVFTCCLRRFFYISCHSSSDFLAALKTSHAKIKRIIGSGSRPQLLMIDSINAFYWIDWAVSSVTLAGPRSGRTALSLQVVSDAVVRELTQILESNPLLILATKSLIQSLTTMERKSSEGTENLSGDGEQKFLKGVLAKDGRAALRDFMPAVWQGFVTHRLFLQGPFQPGSCDTSERPFFTAGWQVPSLNQVEKFIVEDRGITILKGDVV